MDKSHVIPLVVVTFIAGLIGGLYLEKLRYGQTAGEIIRTDNFVHTCQYFETLRDLRFGDTNAVYNSLESELDIGVISLGAFTQELPPSETWKYRNVLFRVKDYRAKYPRHTDDSAVDAQVAAALAEGRPERKP
jgi:hypothetical protein